MSGTKIDPPKVVALADALEAKAPTLQRLGGGLVRAAAPVRTGAAELDEQTRATVAKVQAALAACADAFEAITDALDRTVRKYVETNQQAEAEQKELLAMLDRLRQSQPPERTPSS
ncbi:MAG TPA: hypothetical protein VF062_25695 [Candidatus Limnocylindrales bacterium]